MGARWRGGLVGGFERDDDRLRANPEQSRIGTNQIGDDVDRRRDGHRAERERDVRHHVASR